MSVVALALALATLGARGARADEKAGAVGFTKSMAVSLGVGTLKEDVLGDESGQGAYPLKGSLNVFRLRGGGFVPPATRFGSWVAAEGSFGIGWFDKSAIAKDDTALQQMTWGRLYLDFDFGIAVALVHWKNLRFSGLLGWGLSTDQTSLYGGGKMAFRLGGLEGEIAYTQRFGDSVSDPTMREERTAVALFYGWFSLGFEAWHGYMEDDRGLASAARAFKGGYTYQTLYAAWVF